MRKFIRQTATALTIALLGAWMAGCASIVDGGKTETVNISSQPPGATVVITDTRSGSQVFTGTTPTMAVLDRSAGYFKSASYRVEFSLDGHQTYTTTIEGRPGGWYLIGNFFFGGLIGWILVDPATGAMWTLEDNVAANLPPPRLIFRS